jgi:hypothetical protein
LSRDKFSHEKTGGAGEGDGAGASEDGAGTFKVKFSFPREKTLGHDQKS